MERLAYVIVNIIFCTMFGLKQHFVDCWKDTKLEDF